MVRVCSDSEEGSYLRLIDLCITQLSASEFKEEHGGTGGGAIPAVLEDFGGFPEV